MTVVNPKSISGINSITTGSGSDNLLTIHTSDASSTERVRVNSSGDVIVGSGITVSPDGDIFTTGVTTATTFVGALTGNVTGNINGNLTGTLQTAAQTNITSVGSLSSLVVTGGITATGGNIVMNDSSGSSANRIKLGTSQDLELYHNGSNSMIEDNGTGNLEIRTNGTKITLQGGNNPMINAVKDGAVELYHNNVKMIETISTGTSIPDGKFAKFGDGNDMSMGHNTYNYITYTGADFMITGDNSNLVKIMPRSDEQSAVFRPNGAVELYHDGTKQCETSANGLAFPSGKGIDFSATGGGDLGGTGSSELLDDYEEGSCTFTFVPASGSYGAVYTTGHYTKIGDIVHVTGSISINGATGASGEVQISGLPFSVRGVNSTWSGEGGHGTGRWFYGGPNHFVHLVCDNSTDRMRVHKGDGTFLNHTDMNTSYNASQYSFTVTYFHA